MTSDRVVLWLGFVAGLVGCAGSDMGASAGDGAGLQPGTAPGGAGVLPSDPLGGVAGGAALPPMDPKTSGAPADPAATQPLPGVGMTGPTADTGGSTAPPPATAPGDGFVRGPAPTRASASAPGPYATDSETMGLRDPAEYGTQTLWYPIGADPPFASIAIVPGFVSPESSIAPWGPFLASHGIVVLTIGTNSGADSPEIRSTALLAALDTLRAENARSGSPVQGALDLSRLAVGGWSMGGGGTLLTANAHPELKAAMAICPWYLSAPFSQVQVPTLMFAGTSDVLAGGMSQPFYTAIPESTPKLLMEISGADHFYANNPIGASNQVGLYGLSWLKVFLEGDERYREFLPVEPIGASDFRTNVTL